MILLEVIKTEVEGLLIIKPKVFADDRGYFFESYNEDAYREAGIDFYFVQDNISKYESVHGIIKEVKGSGPAMPLNFGGPTAQA